MIILFDKPLKVQSFIVRIIGREMKEYGSPETGIQIIGWLKGVVNVIHKSEKGEIILFWFDFQAILCYWLCRLTFRSRKIICINIMFKDKLTIRNRLVGWLYKKALESSCFKASVTSIDYGKWLHCRFGNNFKLTLIHDVYHDDYEVKSFRSMEGDGSVFCGGKNGRDWTFMIEVAKLLPDVTFRFVMPMSIYYNLKKSIPQNVIVHCHIPLDDFMEEMCKSSLVCLPLDTIAPAGLIVMFEAAANNKLVMMTDTETTREYIKKENGVLLPRNARAWAESIFWHLSHKEVAKNKAINLRTFLRKECTEEKFVEGIRDLLNMCLK